MHTHVSSSYRWTRACWFRLSFFLCFLCITSLSFGCQSIAWKDTCLKCHVMYESIIELTHSLSLYLILILSRRNEFLVTGKHRRQSVCKSGGVSLHSSLLLPALPPALSFLSLPSLLLRGPTP